MANSKPTVGYWGIRGLGQPIRFLATYLGVELNEKRYTSPDQWQAEKFNLGLDFPNLPYLIEGDIKITESRAIIRYIARERGGPVFPSTPEANRTCDMLENVLWDIWFSLLRYCNAPDEPMKGYFNTEIPKKFGYLNKYLENRKYILGDQISYVDFILYEMLYHYTAFKADYLEAYPTLQRFKLEFEKIPAISNYIASANYIKGPCNNPMAKIAF